MAKIKLVHLWWRSTLAATRSAGNEVRYTPWGETRWAWELDGEGYTRRLYTSQLAQNRTYVGQLYDYEARSASTARPVTITRARRAGQPNIDASIASGTGLRAELVSQANVGEGTALTNLVAMYVGASVEPKW